MDAPSSWSSGPHDAGPTTGRPSATGGCPPEPANPSAAPRAASPTSSASGTPQPDPEQSEPGFSSEARLRQAGLDAADFAFARALRRGRNQAAASVTGGRKVL
ncbi:hypothetical protein GCM10023079_06800 [Streptomyces chitinivorans]